MLEAVATLLVIAAVAAAASIIGFTLRTGIGPVPSTRRARRAMLAAAADAPAGDVVDPGSGWGTLAIAFARRYPARRVVGYEVSWVPWLVSAALARLMRLHNVSFRRADFATADLSCATLLVCFLFPRGMDQLAQRLRRGDCRPALVISNTFALPGVAPHEVVRLDDLFRTKIYVYRAPWPHA